jgi:lysophospholipase L1-like esterase
VIWLVVMLCGCGLGPPRFSDSHVSDHPSLRVLPIGDSYTSGFLSVGGWRPFVHGVDFVGPFCDEALADCEHAGISGRRIEQMIADAPAWVATYDPDVVLLWGGYNDINATAASADETARRMGLLVEAVYAAPRVIVVTTFRTRDRHRDTLDAYDAILRERAPAWGVEIADVRAATSDDAIWIEVTDSVHPTHRGYEAAGAVIAATVRP